MKEQSLREFAENLRARGDWRQAEFADEILQLLDLEDEVAEPYSALRCDIEQYAKDFSNPDDAAKALEWIGDRSNMLADIEKALEEAGRKPEGTNDTADAVQELLDTLGKAEEILEDAGWPGDGDFIEGIVELAERPKPMEYDL